MGGGRARPSWSRAGSGAAHRSGGHRLSRFRSPRSRPRATSMTAARAPTVLRVRWNRQPDPRPGWVVHRASPVVHLGVARRPRPLLRLSLRSAPCRHGTRRRRIRDPTGALPPYPSRRVLRMTRTSPRWRWLVAVVLVLGVVAAACSSDSDSDKKSSSSTSGGGGTSAKLAPATLNGPWFDLPGPAPGRDPRCVQAGTAGRDGELPGCGIGTGQEGLRCRPHQLRWYRLPREARRGGGLHRRLVPLLPARRGPDHGLVQRVGSAGSQALRRHDRQDLPAADHEVGR